MKKFLLAASLLALTACKHDSTPVVAPVFVPVVTTVTVTPSANQIEIGRQAAFTAIVKDQRDSVMTGKTIAWASSNPAVASVTGTGAVVGITRGSTVITATTEGKTGSASLFVIDQTVASVAITTTVPSPFYVGQTLQATAVVKDAANNVLSAYAVTWTSTDTTVVGVSSTGLLTAKKAGTVTITASSGGKSATLAVTTSLVPVSSVTLVSAGTALKGRSVQISPTLKSSSGATLTTTQRTLTWASTDTTVATIDATGLLRGMSVGTSTISCIVENKVGLLNVTVSRVGISYIVVTPDSANITVGTTRQFTAQAFGADSVALNTTELDGRTFTWSVANPATATTSISGLVTGVAAGSTTVQAAIGPVNKSSVVVVVP